MNYTKVITHKKRTVIPFLNIEVRGRVNFLLALVCTIPVFFILLLITSYLAVAGSVVTFVVLSIYLNELDDESNSVVYKKYVEIAHKSGFQNICWFDGNKARITNKKKISCNIINLNNYTRGID